MMVISKFAAWNLQEKVHSSGQREKMSINIRHTISCARLMHQHQSIKGDITVYQKKTMRKCNMQWTIITEHFYNFFIVCFYVLYSSEKSLHVSKLRLNIPDIVLIWCPQVCNNNQQISKFK